MQPRPASATPYYVEQPFRPAGSPYLGSGDFSSWSAADPFQQAQPRYPAAPPRFDPHADQSPTRSLWIGNLDPHVDASTLAAAFRGFGPIESTRVLRERDCAFVNFLDPAHAVAARNAMQGRAIGGMPVRIGFGRVERGEREGAGEQVPTKSVWIGNLPGGVEAEDLRRIFRQFGPMESARVLTHKNCGFVNFENIEHAMEAVRAMHGTQIGPNFVRLGYAKVPAREGFPRPLADAGYGYPAAGTWQDEQAYRDDAAFEGPEPAPFPAAPGGEDYMSAIPELPDPAPHRRPDQARLREMRKKLEGQGHAGVGLRELDAMFAECEDDFVGLSTDYIGNVVLQKILERVGDHYRQRFINQVAPYLAAIGVHKNGTWLAQKLIQLSRTPQHMDTIVASIRPYTYRLLQDQVGNYVVQQCLSFTDGRNQFVFDAMSGPRCREIATDRYGARCMRTCLELPQTSQLQQRQVAAAIIRNGRQLAVNPNGVLLVTWLLETSQLHGRYRLLAQQFEEEMAGLACDKLASTIIVKLVNQRVELDARRIVFDALFFNDGWRSGIQHVLNDFAHGVALLQKFLSSTYLDHEEKTRVADRIRMGLAAAAADVARNANAGYRRLIDELRMLPVGPDGVQAVATLGRFGVDAGIGAFPGYHAIDQMAAQGEAPVVLASAGPSFRDAPAMPDFAPFQMQPPAQDLQAGWNGMPAYPPARGQYNQSADPDALQL
ncbi:armadillo-type protein [Hyaloraphidium curvatum]|nr:armadillo-type protein [Hyaloraphidium curvatum]